MIRKHKDFSILILQHPVQVEMSGNEIQKDEVVYYFHCDHCKRDVRGNNWKSIPFIKYGDFICADCAAAMPDRDKLQKMEVLK